MQSTNHAMPKVKVLFVLKDALRGCGVTKVTLNLANQLKDQGHEVGIYIMDNSHAQLEQFHHITTFVGNKGGSKGILKYFFHLSRHIKNQNYNLVISAKEQANILTFLASLISKNFMPIYTRHSSFDVSEQDLSAKTLVKLYSLYGKGRGKIVAVSNDLANYMKLRMPKAAKKIYCCPNPVVNHVLFEKSSDNLDNFSFSKPYMCAVGRLCEPKGFDLLLKIYRLAMDDNEDIPDLVIVGEGPDLEELKLQCKSLKLESRVYFTGYMTNPYYIMANSELFLLSSRNEGLPTVLIEALALKKNIVAFDCPTGPDEILKHGEYGTLIPVGNIELFAHSINQLLKNRIEIPEKAIEKYTYKESSNAYLALVN